MPHLKIENKQPLSVRLPKREVLVPVFPPSPLRAGAQVFLPLRISHYFTTRSLLPAFLHWHIPHRYFVSGKIYLNILKKRCVHTAKLCPVVKKLHS
jgi:hypothetical protein